KFRDLIKKDRPAVSSFEPANALLHSAREGAFLMTEQFAGDQFCRQSSTIQFHQGAFCTWRAAMNRVRHQLLSGSGLAGNQNRRNGWRDLFDCGQYVLKRTR